MDNLLVEVRYVEDDTRQSPGRLTGTLITYGEVARDRAERFMRGALAWAEAGIVINEQHNRAAPIVRAVPFLDGDALKIDAALAEHPARPRCCRQRQRRPANRPVGGV